MPEVSAGLVTGMLAMAGAAGFAVDPLLVGLPFDERSLQRLRNVTWDDYCTVVERFEHACGGPDEHHAIVTKHHRTLLSAEVRRLMGGVVSPEALLGFVIRTLCPHSFPTVDFESERQPDGRFLVSGRLRPSARPCRAFFVGSVPYMQHVTEHLGLPPSDVEIVELTERALVFFIRLPPSRTLVARVKNRAHHTLDASLEVMRLFAAEARHRLEARSSAEPDRLARRLSHVEQTLGLSPRQRDVLERIVRGRSNKEIAVELDCASNTIEHHVTQLFRKTKTSGRTQLVTWFWSA